MKHKDYGILLKKIPYSENSFVIQLFCKSLGLKSLIFQGGKKKKGNALYPMALLEIEYFLRPDSELGKMSNFHFEFLPQTFFSMPIKSSLLFFFVEILQQSIRHEEKDEALFVFLTQEICYFDEQDLKPNYALWWVLELSKYFGICPQASSVNSSFIDSYNGEIVETPDFSEKISASGEHVQLIAKLLLMNKETALAQKSSHDCRKKCMYLLMDYFQLHIDGFKRPSSLEIIENLWVE
jgi:DNA repair protein RecO (recombination protein O)